jgi:hypothetical protein
MLSYFTARLSFHEQRWSYHLRKSDAPWIVTLYAMAFCGVRLPWVVLAMYVVLSLLLNTLGKVWDHWYYRRALTHYGDAGGDLFVIGMLPVPGLLWCVTGKPVVGVSAMGAWAALYGLLALVGWSDEPTL